MRRILFLSSFVLSCVKSQWTPESTIIDTVIALSPDGLTAIFSRGIYTKANISWILTQPLTFASNQYMRGLFLSEDGSVIAISNSSQLGSIIEIYNMLSPGVWSVSSTISASYLGVDSSAVIYPAAISSDKNTLIVVDTISFTDIFILNQDVSGFVLKQQLLGLPYFGINKLALSADGSTLATLWANSIVIIFARNPDGTYKISEEHSSFINWNQLAISADSQILIGAVSATTPDFTRYIHFFSRIDGRYQLISIVNVGGGTKNFDGDPGMLLCISSDASIIFSSVGNNPSAQNMFSIITLRRINQSTWLIAQTITDPSPPQQNDYSFGWPLVCSADGSTFLSGATNNPPYPNPLYSLTYSFTATLPSPQASSTPSSSSSPTATQSTTTSSTSTAIVTKTVTASSSNSASSSASLSPSTSSSSSPTYGSSSSSSSTLPQPATITISVLSTTLTLISIALFVKWFSNYRTKLTLRADSSDRSEALLRVN